MLKTNIAGTRCLNENIDFIFLYNSDFIKAIIKILAEKFNYRIRT